MPRPRRDLPLGIITLLLAATLVVGCNPQAVGLVMWMVGR